MGFHATVLGHPPSPVKGVLRAPSWDGGREKPGVSIRPGQQTLFFELL